MEFSVLGTKMVKGLNDISLALPVRSTLPILQNILFDLKEKSLELTATNLDITVKTEIEVDNIRGEKGQFTMPGKIATNIFNSLTEDTIKITHTNGNSTITTARGNYTLRGLNPEDFPKMKEIETNKTFSFTGDDVIQGSGQISFCVAREDPRPFLTGILWQVKNGELRFVASDSHKLGLWKKKIKDTHEEFEAIVPKIIFDYIKTQSPNEIVVKVEEDVIGVYMEKSFSITRLIEGPYAPYEDVIPKEEGSILYMNREELTQALRRLSVFAHPPTHLVRWRVSTERNTLFSASPDVGEAEEELRGEYTGEEMEIGFNIQYLTDIVRHLNTETIEVHLQSPLAPVVVKPRGEREEELLYLLMPIKME